MEPRQAAFQVRERIKLLAYEDRELGIPVVIDLVYGSPAGNLEELDQHVDLGDIVDFVRQAHAKLPRLLQVTEAQLELKGTQPLADEAPSLDLPQDLLKKRFVFPTAIEQTVGRDFFARESLTAIRPLAIGRGDGGPFARSGILGRAAEEERAGTSDHPFFYASLLLLLQYISEQARSQLMADDRIKETLDEFRRLLKVWTVTLTSRVHRALQASRILMNPLAPYALMRRPAPPPLKNATDTYLSYGNEYRLTPSLADALDAYFGVDANRLAQNTAEYGRFREAVARLAETIREAVAAKKRMIRRRRILTRWGILSGLLLGLGFISLGMLDQSGHLLPFSSLLGPEMARRATLGAAIGAGVAAGLGIFSWLRYFLARRLSPKHRAFISARRSLRGARVLKRALAGSLAFAKLVESLEEFRHDLAQHSLKELRNILPHVKELPSRIRREFRRAERPCRPPRGAWASDFPELLDNYLKLKADQIDYIRLGSLDLPDLDFSRLYPEMELKNKWAENACVCYGDAFPTLLIGAARTAAVYFIDVIGSTEISSQQALSNVLELYSRILPMVNESGGAPLWRKEVGDGRFYCHPVGEALRRAVLTYQSCYHPKVNVEVGIGLSVGEIYTDVTTGDFLNEAANRAARLNGRDEVVAAYVEARYLQRPFRVYVKYGRLHNTGLAIDEKALHALGVSGWGSLDRVPPMQWMFPVISEEETPGNVRLFAERVTAETMGKRLKGLGDPSEFASYRQALDRALVFEIFCRKSVAELKYQRPRDGRTVEEYLAARGALNPVYIAGESSREDTVTHFPAVLPNGQNVNLVIKYQKAYLRGLGSCVIAEVDPPGAMMPEDISRLERFLSAG